MRYITPDFIEAYEIADSDKRQKMLRSILETWDLEYLNLISSGITPDIIWDIGIGQIGAIIGADGAVEYH